jgi:prefoldin subunit 5
MALMDDLKKKTEEGLKTLKETAGEIAFSVEKQAKIAKRKMDIMKIQRKIQKLYTEIGEYVYGESAMERTLTVEAPFLAERIASITEMKSEIRESEAEIEETRKMQPPKREDIT